MLKKREQAKSLIFIVVPQVKQVPKVLEPIIIAIINLL